MSLVAVCLRASNDKNKHVTFLSSYKTYTHTHTESHTQSLTHSHTHTYRMSWCEVTRDWTHCAQHFCQFTYCSVKSDGFWQQTGSSSCCWSLQENIKYMIIWNKLPHITCCICILHMLDLCDMYCTTTSQYFQADGTRCMCQYFVQGELNVQESDAAYCHRICSACKSADSIDRTSCLTCNKHIDHVAVCREAPSTKTSFCCN